jgi:hypothetical protein
MESPKSTSFLLKIFQVIEDFFTIIKCELELAKNNLSYSAKKIGIGIGFLLTSLFLINITLLFLLITLAFGFADLGLKTWISFLLVSLITFALATFFIFLGFKSFRKIKGISDAARIGSETKKYLAENIKKYSP